MDSYIPICLAFDDKYAPHGATVIKSIQSNIKDGVKIRFYILNEGLRDETVQKLDSLVGDTLLSTIVYVDVRPVFSSIELFSHSSYNRAIYYRLAIAEILPTESRVIYLDSDIIVDSDISSLYETDMCDKIIAAAEDIHIHCLRKTHGLTNSIGRKSVKSYVRETVGLNEEEPYFQSGIMLVDLKLLRQTNLADDAIELASKSKLWMPDQDIINKLFKGYIHKLPQCWNVLTGDGSYFRFLSSVDSKLSEEYQLARKKPKIVHYSGITKPWIYYDVDYANLYWKYFSQTPWSNDVFTILANGNLRSTRELPMNISFPLIFRAIFEKIFSKGSQRRHLALLFVSLFN